MVALGIAIIIVGIVTIGFLQRNRKPEGDAFATFGQALSVLGIAAAGLGLMAFAKTGGPGASLTSIEGSEIVDMELNEPLGDFEFTLANTGETGRLSDYSGKVVLLNVWATWCAPCLKEIPALNRVQEDYVDQGLIVLSLSDEPKEDLDEFSQTVELKTVSGMVPDSEGLPRLLKSGFELRPTTLLIDREGNVRKYMLGDRDYSFFENVIQEYL